MQRLCARRNGHQRPHIAGSSIRAPRSPALACWRRAALPRCCVAESPGVRDEQGAPGVARSHFLGAAAAAAALGVALLHGRALAGGAVPPRPLPLASLSLARADAQPPAFTDMLIYRLMKVFEMPAVGKVASLVAFSMPAVLLSALAFSKVAGSSLADSVKRTYSLMVGLPSPANTVESQKAPAADMVLHGVFYSRVLVFSLLLGIVTQDIAYHVHQVRHGNHALIEAHHTVVINWSSTLKPLLQQMALAHAEDSALRGPFVVLADKSKEEMDAELSGSVRGVRVLTRSGDATKAADLRRAAVAAADAVIVLFPEDISDPAEACAQQAAVLTALRSAGGLTRQRVIVQSGGEAAQEFNSAQIAVEACARRLPGHVAALTTSGHERINQLLAQVANQPHLEEVFADLLEYEDAQAGAHGAEFYMAGAPQHLAGHSFQHVRRCFDRATLVGFVQPGPDRQLRLNPRDAEVVPAGAELVFVAGTAADEVARQTPYEVTRLPLNKRMRRQQQPRNICVLCFDASAARDVLRSLSEFCARGSCITLVCNEPPPELKHVHQRGVRVRLVDGSPASSSVLRSKAARLEEADAVVLCGLFGKPPAAADTQVVASVLQLQQLATQHKGRTAPLAVVATLNDAGTEDVLWHAVLTHHAELRADAAAAARASATDAGAAAQAAAAAAQPALSLHLLKPDELLSGMLTQAACAPQLANVFAELFTESSGHEVYLRDPRAFGLRLDSSAAWSDVAEVVRGRGETAIGYIRAGAAPGPRLERGGPGAAAVAGGAAQADRLDDAFGAFFPRVELGVPAATQVVLGPHDRLVTIALE